MSPDSAPPLSLERETSDAQPTERSCWTAGYDPGCACCELLAHKWTPQIVTVLLSGPHRFCALHAAIPGLSDKVLCRRLTELEGAGIVTRAYYPEIPPRVEYALTRPGLALEPVIREMDRWSREFAPRCTGEPRAEDG